MTARRGLLTLAVVALFASSIPASAAPGGKVSGRIRSGRCTDKTDTAKPLALPIRVGEGQTEIATGHYALPDQAPKAIVVFAHGYGHTSYSWIHHMTRTAREHGVVAVGVDYRGIEIKPDSDDDGLPESRGWNAMKGAEDLVAAAQFFNSYCKTARETILMGVSMGANMSGLALALAPPSEDPLFDQWIDVEGAVNVIETYLGARALAPVNDYAAKALEDIEKEMGGPIEENPQAYQERAVVTRVDEIKESGVQGVTLIHGLDDGLVPYNQSREMSTLLLGAGIPTDMYTVGRRSPESEQETTATGYVGSRVDPNYKSPFAGHASEKSTTHIIMVTAFERLAAILDGEVPSTYSEHFVDGEAGTFP
jgi:acetyl esterase/lipase